MNPPVISLTAGTIFAGHIFSQGHIFQGGYFFRVDIFSAPVFFSRLSSLGAARWNFRFLASGVPGILFLRLGAGCPSVVSVAGLSVFPWLRAAAGMRCGCSLRCRCVVPLLVLRLASSAQDREDESLRACGVGGVAAFSCDAVRQLCG